MPRRPPRRNATAKRRASGELEGAVMVALWAADEAMTPAMVQAAMGGNLAYTTVMTILARLHEKGVIERAKAGRAFAYRPIVAEADVVAEHVRRLLDRGQDRTAVLQGLVDGLRPEEGATLRTLLARADAARAAAEQG